MHTQNICIYIYLESVGIRCWTNEKEYSMSFGRSRDSLLWLKTSSCDLSSLQRFHVETGSRQWLKTRCNELTLLLVPQRVENVSDYIVRSLGQRGLLIRYLYIYPENLSIFGHRNDGSRGNASPDPMKQPFGCIRNVSLGTIATPTNIEK